MEDGGGEGVKMEGSSLSDRRGRRGGGGGNSWKRIMEDNSLKVEKARGGVVEAGGGGEGAMGDMEDNSSKAEKGGGWKTIA